jgi:hypothetical protein
MPSVVVFVEACALAALWAGVVWATATNNAVVPAAWMVCAGRGVEWHGVVHSRGSQSACPLLPAQDEVFHVPQTQAYCAGSWGEWRPRP